MGIPLASSFTMGSALPLDDRTIAPDITARDAINSAVKYAGLKCYVVSTDTTYRWDGSAWVADGGASTPTFAVEQVIDVDTSPTVDQYDVLLMLPFTADRTVNLPAGYNKVLWIKKASSSSYAVNIIGTVDGENPFVLTRQNEAIGIARDPLSGLWWAVGYAPGDLDPDGYAIGDTALSYNNLKPGFLALNGQTIFPQNYQELYDSMTGVAAVNTSIQTVSSPQATASANFRFFGWITSTLALFSMSGGDLGNTNTGNLYKATYDPTTHTFGTVTRIDDTLGIPNGASLQKFPMRMLREYIVLKSVHIAGLANYYVIKWTGSTFIYTKTFTLTVSSSFDSVVDMFTRAGKDYMAIRTQQNNTILLYERVVEDWVASTTTFNAGAIGGLGTISNSVNSPLAFSDDGTRVIVNFYDTVASFYRPRCFKYDSGTNTYIPMTVTTLEYRSGASTITTDDANANVPVATAMSTATGAVGLFTNVSPSSAAKTVMFTANRLVTAKIIGTTTYLYMYTLNTSTDKWVLTSWLTNTDFGFSTNTGFHLPVISYFLSAADAELSYPTSSGTKFAMLCRHSTSTTSFKKKTLVISGDASAGWTMAIDPGETEVVHTHNTATNYAAPLYHYGLIDGDPNFTTQQGQLFVQAIRKSLANIANPATGLVYQVKAQ